MATAIRGSSLYLNVDGPSWIQSQENAQKQGGYLAIINSAEENNFIFTNFLTQITGNYRWFGLSDAAEEGSWRWVNNENLGYSNWASLQPDNATRFYFAFMQSIYEPNGEDYAAFGNNGQWMDRRNNDTISTGGIAEIPLTSAINFSTTLKEGTPFTTSINLSAGSSTNLANGATVFWKITGITEDDLASGSLTGSGTINNGKLELQHSLKVDPDTGEQLEISVFSDAAMTQQIGSTASSLILEGAPPRTSTVFSMGDLTIKEGTSGSLVVTRTGDISTQQQIQIDMKDGTATFGGYDYGIRVAAGVYPFAPGVSSIVLEFIANQDSIAEGLENFFVEGTNILSPNSNIDTSWSKRVGTVSIIDNPPPKPTRVPTPPIINDGTATFRINGNGIIGETLIVSRTSDDPDGINIPTYIWQSSADGINWVGIGAGDNYRIQSADLERNIRVQVKYTDGDGFNETVTTDLVKVARVRRNDGTSTFKIDGTVGVGNTLNVLRLSDDPDGNGSPVFTWKSLETLNSSGRVIGAGSSYTITKDDIGKLIQVTVSYTDGEDFVETPSVLVVSVPNLNVVDNSRRATFDFAVKDYKIGTTLGDKVEVTNKEKVSSWALWGKEGDDVLIGGSRNDYLVGGDGIDTLTGGKGKDTFIIGDMFTQNYDVIRDFSVKDDVIGFIGTVVEYSSEDSVAMVSFRDIKNKSTAQNTFKNKDADRYILVDTLENIRKVSTKNISKKIMLAVDLTNKAILYDIDGNWNKGSDILCKYSGNISRDQWKPENFAFGVRAFL